LDDEKHARCTVLDQIAAPLQLRISSFVRRNERNLNPKPPRADVWIGISLDRWFASDLTQQEWEFLCK